MDKQTQTTKCELSLVNGTWLVPEKIIIFVNTCNLFGKENRNKLNKNKTD